MTRRQAKRREMIKKGVLMFSTRDGSEHEIISLKKKEGLAHVYSYASGKKRWAKLDTLAINYKLTDERYNDRLITV